MKVLENSQKAMEDKAGGSSLDGFQSKEEKGKQIGENEEEEFHSDKEEDSKFVIIDPHGNQLEALMHRNDLKEAGITRVYPIEWESTPFLKKY